MQPCPVTCRLTCVRHNGIRDADNRYKPELPGLGDRKINGFNYINRRILRQRDLEAGGP